MEQRKKQVLFWLGVTLPLVILAAVGIYLKNAPYHTPDPASPELPPIARPASFIGPNEHAVSIAALDAAYSAGFTHFFVPLSFTRDNHLVCIFDWQNDSPAIFRDLAKPEHMSFDKFSAAPLKGAHRPCALPELLEWLKQHPRAIVVLNMQGRLIEALGRIRQSLPSYKGQIIPHVWMPGRQYKTIFELGYERMMFALPRFPAKNNAESILRAVDQYAFVGVTIPPAFADRRKFLLHLDEKSVPVYIQEYSDCGTYRTFRATLGIDGAYLNASSPMNCGAAQIPGVSGSPPTQQ